MYENIMWLFSGLLVIITVSIHYEVMMVVSDYVVPWAQRHVHNRRVVAFAIAGMMVGHIIEIWIFSLAMMLILYFPVMGSVQGDFTNRWEDFLYLSSTNYTSLGDNNIRLVGPARVMASSEALAGVMMIAWSASFTYLKMEQIWRRGRTKFSTANKRRRAED